MHNIFDIRKDETLVYSRRKTSKPFFRRKTKMKLFHFMNHSGNREEIRQDAKVRCYVCINGVIMPVL